MEWQDIKSAPENTKVMTKIDDHNGERNIQPMTRRGNLWWINEDELNQMYAYYTPTHWKALVSKK